MQNLTVGRHDDGLRGAAEYALPPRLVPRVDEDGDVELLIRDVLLNVLVGQGECNEPVRVMLPGEDGSQVVEVTHAPGALRREDVNHEGLRAALVRYRRLP